ncbi:MAG: BlaI/MecI/CopY family transcriptional regulator [Planctomycetaceae bacterium]|nr:BlaI/MecI/CopY family transcriptional regulator [Planctomycetaceae bacterium]
MAARPAPETPTDGELEILKVLWQRGPSTVREVLEVLNRQRERAYTSIMTMMNLMVDKGLLQREPQGRAFIYRPASAQRAVLSEIVDNLVGKAFDGSPSSLVTALLDKSKLSPEEAERIKDAIIEYQEEKGIR